MTKPKKKRAIFDGRRRSYTGDQLCRAIKKRFKYVIEADGVLENKEAVEWLRDAFGKELFYCSDYNDDRYVDCYVFKKDAIWDSYDGVVYFKNANDAALFKLYWIK